LAANVLSDLGALFASKLLDLDVVGFDFGHDHRARCRAVCRLHCCDRLRTARPWFAYSLRLLRGAVMAFAALLFALMSGSIRAAASLSSPCFRVARIHENKLSRP
jgi:hypothetical protein